jgi:hypothetical protein
MDDQPIPKPNPRADWMGSMKNEIKILGDIVSPASEERDWEVLQDFSDSLADPSEPV